MAAAISSMEGSRERAMRMFSECLILSTIFWMKSPWTALPIAASAAALAESGVKGEGVGLVVGV